MGVESEGFGSGDLCGFCSFNFIIMMFTVLTVNVRGLRDPIKRAAFFSSLASMRGDIFLLQEVHLRDKDDVRIFSQEWTGGPSRWSVGSVHSNGVGILFKGQAFSIEEVMTVVAGRIIVVDFSLASVRYRAINVYAPAQDEGRLEMFGEIPACLCATRTVILGGDLIDRSGAGSGSGKVDYSARALGDIVHNFSLVDVWRATHPGEAGHTWRNSRGRPAGLITCLSGGTRRGVNVH